MKNLVIDYCLQKSDDNELSNSDVYEAKGERIAEDCRSGNESVAMYRVRLRYVKLSNVILYVIKCTG